MKTIQNTKGNNHAGKKRNGNTSEWMPRLVTKEIGVKMEDSESAVSLNSVSSVADPKHPATNYNKPSFGSAAQEKPSYSQQATGKLR